MVLQAFIDDSYTANGTFVLGGFIASAEAWVAFSKEWEALLPIYGTRAKNGKHHFKMSKMIALKLEDRVPYFYKIIAKYAIMGISFKINIAELEYARRRIWIENDPHEWELQLPYLRTTFGFAFRGLLDLFHANRLINEKKDEIAEALPLDQVVDFYFDDQTEKGQILAAWDDYIQGRPDAVKGLYGATPRFENDQAFLPLQAADLWAWLVRRAYEEGELADLIDDKFAFWDKKQPHISKMIMSADEDEIAENVIRFIRSKIGHSQAIYDAKYHPQVIRENAKTKLLLSWLREIFK